MNTIREILEIRKKAGHPIRIRTMGGSDEVGHVGHIGDEVVEVFDTDLTAHARYVSLSSIVSC